MDDARELLAARLGARPLHRIAGGGYTLMEHWLVELADGGRGFAKLAVDEPTAEFLRAEHRVYSQLDAPFAPDLLAWEDDGERPVLVLEDLSEGHWPPPWREGDVDAVLQALDDLHGTSPPDGLPQLTADDLSGWREVEADPKAFLALRLCSPEWLEQALPELVAASERCPIAGDSFLHLDVRSDNICLREGRALLVDWNWAHLGNPNIDVAFWLPSLFTEGGPAPTELLPDAGEVTAVVSGFFAPRAGLPPPGRRTDRAAAPARAAQGRAAVGGRGARSAAA